MLRHIADQIEVEVDYLAEATGFSRVGFIALWGKVGRKHIGYPTLIFL